MLEAFERADFLWIGLTKIFQPGPEAADGIGREQAASNPLTFLERSELVEAAIASVGVPQDRFRITPFPIENPERLHEFVPHGSMCFTTLVNEWNDEKVRRLNANGFPTAILSLSKPDNIRVTSGTEIRRLLRAGDPTWARFVPVAVAEMIIKRFRDRFNL